MNKHATIRLGDYNIPLIGIPSEAALQECSLCHDMFPIRDVELIGTQFLCRKCRTDKALDGK